MNDKRTSIAALDRALAAQEGETRRAFDKYEKEVKEASNRLYTILDELAEAVHTASMLTVAAQEREDTSFTCTTCAGSGYNPIPFCSDPVCFACGGSGKLYATKE